MRVLHVDSGMGWRGGQNQVLLTAEGMAQRGHEVVVACREAGALAQRARAAHLDVRELGLGSDLSPGAALGLRRLARAFRPEVVHVHDAHAAAAALVLPRGTAIVASRRVDFPLRGAASRWKYGRCRRILAVSTAVADVLSRSGIGRERVRVVYEGVPDRPPEAGGEEALVEMGVPAGAPVIGNVAALTAHKDHATLLAAAARALPRLPGAHVVIVGDGELGPALRAQAAALGVTGSVVFAGFRKDAARLLAAFTVFCLSSKMEGLGTSLLDAMCFARPVVATAAGGIAEAVEDRVTGRLVPPGDAEALAAALVDVVQDPAACARMGAAGRQRFRERFTAERMVTETLAVYADAA